MLAESERAMLTGLRGAVVSAARDAALVREWMGWLTIFQGRDCRRRHWHLNGADAPECEVGAWMQVRGIDAESWSGGVRCSLTVSVQSRSAD